MKLSSLIIYSNLNFLFNRTESAARGLIGSLFEKPNENIVRLHSYLTTQYIIQFSIQRFVKQNNSIHKNHNVKIRRLLSELAIDKINLINHQAKHYAVTASKLLIRQKLEGLNSNIWMIDQLSLISNLEDSEIIKLFPKLSDLMKLEINKCELAIKKTKFPSESFQEGLFDTDVNNVGIELNSNRKRNVVRK